MNLACQEYREWEAVNQCRRPHYLSLQRVLQWEVRYAGIKWELGREIKKLEMHSVESK